MLWHASQAHALQAHMRDSQGLHSASVCTDSSPGDQLVLHLPCSLGTEASRCGRTTRVTADDVPNLYCYAVISNPANQTVINKSLNLFLDSALFGYQVGCAASHMSRGL